MSDATFHLPLAGPRTAARGEPSQLRDCLCRARRGLRLAAEQGMPLPDQAVAAVIATERALDQGALSAEQEERFWHAYAQVCSGAVEAATVRRRYNIAFLAILVVLLAVQSIQISASGLLDAVKEQWAIVLAYENGRTPACASSAPPPGCPARVVMEPEYHIARSRLHSYDHLLQEHRLLPGLALASDGPGGEDARLEHFHHFVKLGALTNTRRLLELFILPALYGALGACAFVLRRLTAEQAQATLLADSGIRHGLRISIGVVAGLAIHWLVHEPGAGAAAHGAAGLAASLEHLSRIALSFVAGYGSEVVFNILDRLVAALAPGRAEAAAKPAARHARAKPATADDHPA